MKKKPSIDCESCESLDKSIFCALEKDGLTSLSLQKNCNVYKKGQTLFLEGNPAFGLYCVNKGKIKITKLGSDGDETIVRIATDGDLLGHRSLFSNTNYGASATVIEESKVCFVSKETINSLIEKNPKLAFEMIHRLSEQMGAAEDRVASLSQKNVRERFAELLLLLNETYGKREARGIRLDIRLTREDMASMIGAASENLIRLVTEFKKEGLIEQDGKTIYLLDVAKITEYAALSY